MIIEPGMKVRLKNKLMHGIVLQSGCDLCTVRIESKIYECSKSELTETILKTIYNSILKAVKRVFQMRSNIEISIVSFCNNLK